MPEQVRLDWSSAVVSDGKLTVGFSDKPPKKWRDVFERTLVLLSQGKWEGCLNSRKGTVQIASIEPGDEDRVRELLEGAVLEANSTLVSEEELFKGPGTDEEADGADEEPAEPAVDDELTERFRAFARTAT
ncbi:MAG TPA: hypothetical protein VHV75_07190 [Solirubrobacteraceae bacterium]|jgi:hypothetical protein|nr:hypothetical protein [Solirubrobacteraceae bacterium]